MVYVYKCGGLFNYITSDTPQETIKCSCGETHEMEETTLKREPGWNVVPETLTCGMDWAAGRKFSTRTERKQYYKEHGLKRVSRKEQRRSLDCTGRKPLGPVSYSGQKHHESRV